MLNIMTLSLADILIKKAGDTTTVTISLHSAFSQYMREQIGEKERERNKEREK